MEIEIEIDHFFGSLEYRKTDNVIDLEGRFDDPDKTEFTVPGEWSYSPTVRSYLTKKYRECHRWKASSSSRITILPKR